MTEASPYSHKGLDPLAKSFEQFTHAPRIGDACLCTAFALTLIMTSTAFDVDVNYFDAHSADVNATSGSGQNG